MRKTGKKGYTMSSVLKALNSDAYTFLIAVIIIIVTAYLKVNNSISESDFMVVIVAIVSYFFGRRVSGLS